MSGHSKWSNIKHKKLIQDSRRSKTFTKLLREISVAARLYGPNVNSNYRLRIAINSAFDKNMSKSTIEKAIEKSFSHSNINYSNLEELRYEGYGPLGVAFIIDCITNNRNRAASEIRNIFSSMNGKLGASGSVSYIFDYKGIISIANKYDESYIIDIALNNNVNDVLIHNNKKIDIITNYDNFVKIRSVLKSKGINITSSQMSLHPKFKINIFEDKIINKIIEIVDRLKNLDYVQHVYNNANFDNKVIYNN